MLFIDVREPSEYHSGHIQGDLNVPPSSLMAGAPELQDVSRDEPLVLYCISGSRSQSAMKLLRDLGFSNLTNGINQHHVSAKYGVGISS